MDKKQKKRQERLRQQRHTRKFGLPKPKWGKITIRKLGIPVTPYVSGRCPLLEKYGLLRPE